MNSRLLVLSMTSASALFACRPDLTIGGEADGGSDGGKAVVVMGAAPVEAAPNDAPPPVEDAAAPPLIVLDASVGGLCASVDAGGTSDTADAQAACWCTRRPGPGTSFFTCPPGIGDNASVTLDPQSTAVAAVTVEGRQGVASGVPASIQFAPGAVQSPTEVTLIETSIAPPVDITDWSPVYAVQPLGLALDSSAKISLPWSNGISGSNVVNVPPDLAIWFSADGSCFTRLPSSTDNAGFNTGMISQLGYFIVGDPRTSATASCP